MILHIPTKQLIAQILFFIFYLITKTYSLS